MPLPPAELVRSRLFDGLTPDQRQAWFASARQHAYAKGEIVARQGDPAAHFRLVASGFLKLLQSTVDGHDLIVRFVGPGEPFGGVVALEKASYPVTAMAIEATRVFAWEAPTLHALLERTPQVRANLMREIAAHMADALTRVRELSTARVGQRLAHALLRLMRQCGRPAANGTLLVHSLTRQELADLTGTTLFTVSRTLSAWTTEGILASDGRRLVIRDRARLERLAHEDPGERERT